MTTRVKFISLQVEQQGQRVFFQLRLPADAKTIIGIETGVSTANNLGTDPIPAATNDWLKIKRHNRIGELRLTGLDQADSFYSCEVVEADENLFRGDYSFEHYATKVINPGTTAEQVVFDYSKPALSFWRPSPPTHSGLYFEDAIELRAQRIVSGYYQDYLGKRLKQDNQYTVKVYIWYETH
jgi:hypothetical protein